MALEEIQQSNFFNIGKTENLPDGATYRCYTVKVVDVTIKNRPAKNIEVVNADTGETQVIPTAGNLKYRVNDGSLKMGVYTEITRNGTAKYGSLPGAAFKVAQDKERTLADAQFESLGDDAPTAKTTTTGYSASFNAEKVKRQAEKLAAQASKK